MEHFGDAAMNRSRSLVTLGILISLVCQLHAGIPLGKNSSVLFATVEKGQEILGARDDFVERLSPFDRAVRLKTAREVSTEEFLRHVRKHVLPWEPDEREKLDSILQSLAPRLAAHSVAFPEEIHLIKTTGEEDSNAAYTRGIGIVLPKGKLRGNPRRLERLICHELFHVLSRHNPALREEFYRSIGFQKCDELKLHPSLKERRLTNPDAPRNDHAIRVEVEGEKTWAIPILFSRTDKYDTERGGVLFRYMQFKLQAVTLDEETGAVQPVVQEGMPLLYDVDEMSGFYEQVGRNTGYIIHPEEILADNYVHWVLGKKELKSPEIVERMQTIFTEWKRQKEIGR